MGDNLLVCPEMSGAVCYVSINEANQFALVEIRVDWLNNRLGDVEKIMPQRFSMKASSVRDISEERS